MIQLIFTRISRAAMVLTFVVFPVIAAPAQDHCVDYSEYPDLQGHSSITGTARGLVALENYLYVASTLSGLQIVDITDPSAPHRISILNSPGQSYGLDCVGELVYLADGSEGMQIISVADPLAPELVGSLNTLGMILNVQVVGNYAYLAADWGSGGLIIVDISDPSSPVQVSHTPAGGTAKDVAVSGQHAYVADTDDHIYIYDVSDPTAPVALTPVAAPNSVWALDISGNQLAAAVYSDGVQTYDLTNPGEPALTGNFRPRALYGSNVIDVFLEGSAGYAVTHLDHLVVFNLDDPQGLRELTTLPMPDHIYAVAAQGSLIFASLGDSGVQVIQNNGFDLPPALGALEIGENFPAGPFDTHNGYAFVASDQLHSVRISDPTEPVVISSTTVGEENFCIDVEGYYAYLLSEPYNRISVFSVANPSFPFLVQSYNTAGASPDRLLAKGNYLYSGPHNGDLVISDIQNPSNAHVLGFAGLNTNFSAICAFGDSLFLGDHSRVDILDISTPDEPVAVGNVIAFRNIEGVTVQGRYLFMVSHYNGLDIVDLHQPDNPIVGQFPAKFPQHVTVHNGIAYVSDLRAGLYVLDVNDVTQPQLLGIKRGGCVKSMVQGDHLVVSGSGYMSGIEILPLQCSELSAAHAPPRPVASLQLSAYPNPFNPRTHFRFELTSRQSVDLSVHDVAGKRIRQLVHHEIRSAGDHEVIWDGRDANGRQLPSGQYFGRLQAGHQTITRPVILLK